MKVAIYGQYFKIEDSQYVEELFQILTTNNINPQNLLTWPLKVAGL